MFEHEVRTLERSSKGHTINRRFYRNARGGRRGPFAGRCAHCSTLSGLIMNAQPSAPEPSRGSETEGSYWYSVRGLNPSDLLERQMTSPEVQRCMIGRRSDRSGRGRRATGSGPLRKWWGPTGNDPIISASNGGVLPLNEDPVIASDYRRHRSRGEDYERVCLIFSSRRTADIEQPDFQRAWRFRLGVGSHPWCLPVLPARRTSFSLRPAFLLTHVRFRLHRVNDFFAISPFFLSFRWIIRRFSYLS